MQSTQVKAHKRKGRVVKSHSRAVKGVYKSCGPGMSAEECKAKYTAIVGRYGEDSPQAKKLAMKMESMETVEKEARGAGNSSKHIKQVLTTKKSSPESRRTLRQENSSEQKEKDAALKSSGRYAMKKKHSRGEYMRKNVEEDLLTKESRFPKVKVRTSIGKMNKIKGLENASEHLSGKKMTKKEVLENKAKATKLRKHSKEAKDKKGKSAYSDKQVANMKATADNKKATHDRMAKLRAMKKK